MTVDKNFSDHLQDLAERVKQRSDIKTEEATKHAFVLPFIRALGYDVFNPSEVTPELIADVGTKKGEKVDYAILQDGKPIIIFECKGHDCNLRDAEYSQLFRYFHVTDARFAVLTNGVEYWFFTDLEAPNKMDAQPFLKIDLNDLDEGDLQELQKFSRTQFNEEDILSTASELKYVRELKRVIANELQEPSEEFQKLLIGRVYDRSITSKVRAQFMPYIEKAYQGHLSEVFSERLKSVIGNQNTSPTPASEGTDTHSQEDEELVDDSGIITTPEEIEGFMIIRAIGASEVDINRIVMRDVQSYCGVLFDDNNRKPICRMYFNGKRKFLATFAEDKSESRHEIASVTGIYEHREAIRATLRHYLSQDAKE